MILILGAGLAGLSASYHLGHDRCVILERDSQPFGHIRSTKREGFCWDTGPHVSFTKNEYVRELFREGVNDAFYEHDVHVSNYYKGHWIAHPAQTSLHQVPEPERTECLQSFLSTRDNLPAVLAPGSNYLQWLEHAFGPVFANKFPAAYTRKYWTRDAAELTTDWIGDRIHYPKIEDVIAGSQHQLSHGTHYISKIRYPQKGGYEVFANKIHHGSHVRYGHEVTEIDLERQRVWLSDGQCIGYKKVINTLPLPVFINACTNAPQSIKDAARRLSCTQLLLVNIAAPHNTARGENWMYVYDEDKLTTRINCTELLSPRNAPSGWTGVQAEVYFSRHRPLQLEPEVVAAKVESELIEMGLIDPSRFMRGYTTHRHFSLSPWANVVFDQDTAPALELIWNWLENFGLIRESDDTSPLTDWSVPLAQPTALGALIMAGRFGQWKYFWSDDCVLRGKRIAEI